MNTSFFGELMQTISERGRALLARNRRGEASARSESLVELCEDLLSGRGEASGVALAREILGHYSGLTIGPRIAFFEALARRFGTDADRMEAAIATWREKPSDATAAEVHGASEPRRQELFRRLNLAPGGTARSGAHARAVDEFARSSRRPARCSTTTSCIYSRPGSTAAFWCCDRSIGRTPAIVLEKIIRYEAVHEIHDWEDLRRRIDPPDRRCYAFFHPALVDEPLIFVEVALTRDIPAAIEPILGEEREMAEIDKARTATFYSISNCQRGLAGVSFGNFLIKQVVEEVSREMPKLSTFVTLSPVTNFAAWLKRMRAEEKSTVLTEADKAALAVTDLPDWWRNEETTAQVQDTLMRSAAWYFLRARNERGTPVDAVARFHLGNGARLERINWLADTSDRAMAQAHGIMVNYLYELDDIEKNHEAYAEGPTVVASGAVQRLLRPPLELVPITG